MSLPAPSTSTLLRDLARRVRELREGRGWTRSELSRRSGLSVRYLARVENGEGNISIRRLEELARALDTTPHRLVRPAAPSVVRVTLVGMRGAGKSTVGPLLAARAGLPFVEMDRLILEASGLPLDQLFELHGERYYRRLERETAHRVLAGGVGAVIAASGGVVHEAETWTLLRERSFVVWLRAAPEDHWNRVVAQGDRRPMADNPAAMDELRAMLAAREPLYRQAALTVDTGRLEPAAVVERILEHWPEARESGAKEE